MKLSCAHDIPLSADVFWEMIHAPDYEEAVAREVGLRVYEEVERREERKAIYRRLRVEADLPEPVRGLVRRIIGEESASYTEEQWRSTTAREVRWRITPSLLPARAKLEGVVRVESRGPGQCTRVLDGVIELRVFAVGPVLERAAVSLVTDAYARGAAVAAQVAAAHAKRREPR